MISTYLLLVNITSDHKKMHLPPRKWMLQTRALSLGLHSLCLPPSTTTRLIIFTQASFLSSGKCGILCKDIPASLFCRLAHPTMQQLCTMIQILLKIFVCYTACIPGGSYLSASTKLFISNSCVYSAVEYRLLDLNVCSQVRNMSYASNNCRDSCFACSNTAVCTNH